MTLQLSGQIAGGNINREFGKQYSSYMSIWHARNGYYGGINSASERYPTNGISKVNSGYAYSDWYGYNHGAVRATIGIFQREGSADCDTRATRYRYDGAYVAQSWQWGTVKTSNWFTMPQYQRLDIYWDNNVGWGSSWSWNYRRIYSNQRGYILNVQDRVRDYRNTTGIYARSGESIQLQNIT
jgi:hypothetical protein|tara:strand:- start:2330 stop:2878 length:549 start_codon:yes stop_codon:yes gene_type:complete